MKAAPLLALALLAAACSSGPRTETGELGPGDEQLQQGEYVDAYTVEAAAGQWIEADLTSDAFDPYLVVAGPSGAYVGQNDDHEGDRRRSHLRVEAAEAGTYRVLATSYGGGEAGPYRLTLAVADGEPPRAGPGGTDVAGAEQPPAARVVNGRPEGLFLMTRYWIATQHLETGVWYFAPGGAVYEGLENGFSPADLAAHEGRRGTARADGQTLTVTWADGSTSRGEVQQSAGDAGFGWDGALFGPAPPFDGRSVAGTYGGGTSVTFSGSTSSSASTLDLRPDGTYSQSGIASFTGGGYSTGSEGAPETGTWSVAGYTLTLRPADGRVVRRIAFPWDSEDTPAYPDRLYAGGLMFVRQ